MTSAAILFTVFMVSAPVEPLTIWDGKVADNELKKFAPTGGVIFDSDNFEKLWKAWRPSETTPEIDFTKEILIIGIVSGPNSVMMRPSLNESGNLQFVVGGTKRAGPGFSYLMMKMKKEGIKTVNGNIYQFTVHDGYFASNQFEPNAPESFVLLKNQVEFDKVFGVGFVMRDKAKRLPKDAFSSSDVVGLIKRGNSLWTYTVDGIGEKDGVLEVRYSAKEMKQPGAQFASPLIVSVPKLDFKSVRFIENGKEHKVLNIDRK